MFEASILSGCWETGIIELRGMPEDFVLSARKLIVLEKEQYEALQAKYDHLREFIQKWDMVHEKGCGALGEGFEGCDQTTFNCDCGYKKARQQALKE